MHKDYKWTQQIVFYDVYILCDYYSETLKIKMYQESPFMYVFIWYYL